MPFDPSKSFTVVAEPPETKAGGFDPSKPFTVVQEGDTPSGRAYAPPPGTSAGSAAAPVRPPTQAFPTEQTQAEAISRIPALSAAETEELAMTPQLRVPQSVKKVLGDIVATGVPGGQLGPVRAAIQGPVNTAAGGLEFLSAPAAGPIAAAQIVPGLNVAVDALFAKQLTESGSQKLGEASVTGDITKATEGLAELLMAGTAGISGGRSIKDVPSRAKEFLREQAKPGPQPPPLLRRSEAELQAMPTERTANAIQERSAAEVPVEAPPGDSAKVVERVSEPETPAVPQDTGQHVDQPQTQEAVLGDVGKEAIPSEAKTQEETKGLLTNKPAPSSPEQATQAESPTAGMVSAAQASGVAAPESPPAKISESTTKLSEAQPEIAAAKRPGGAGPGMVDLGAATPASLAEPGTIVSNMFAAIDRDRAEMGKPPMEPGEPRTWDQDRQIATARMNRDPQWIPDLIKEVNAKPRPLMSWEQAGMVMQKAYWKAEANNALRRIAQAADDGRQADLAQARNDAARWEDNLAAMEEAVGRGGTGSEAGRSLKAQQMGLTDDLSLVEMRLEMRGKLGGRKLTPEEGAEIERIHKDYQQKVAALEKTAAEADRRRVDAETRATLAELARQAAQEKVPPPHIQRIIERIRSSIKSEADAARERLKGKLFTLSPDVVADLARVGADNILTIGEDFARWSAKMIEDIGEKVKPHLQMAWDEALKLINRKSDVESGGQRKVAQTVKTTVKKFDTPDQKIAKLTERVRSRVGQAGKPITPAVQGLARAFVQKGIRDREALIDAVHDVLKDIIPDWTRRKTMDAISGYGDYRVLSKDEVSLALRDMKGQMQQIAKLEDMAGGEAPLRSGVEQREVTKAQQELIKLVNEAKRKGGYQTTDPETQLRTALDEVKKRTQTAIEDYERRLREGDFSVRKLSPIKPDAELLAKQADLKRVRRDWEQAKRQKELANRALWQRFLDRLVRWERAFKLSSPVVFGKLAAAALTRFAETAATETVGKAIKVLPEISTVARQAPREGAGLNVKAAAHALREAFTKGMRDAAQTARKGAADIDVEYGEKLIDRDWVNFFGQLHGMMKAPVKRAEFEYALQQRIEHAIRNGLDPTDPLVAARLHAEALSDGYRSIFMQRGFSSDMFNQLVSQMEKSKKYPVAGEITARTARFLMPIVRVPANIVAETATGIHGLPTASARTMFHAIRGTLGDLDPVVADSIMRQFKKGSIGLGLMAIGFFNPTSIGGYDWREKRALGAVKTAGFQIGGVDIPRWMTHAPWFELMQFGATIRRVMEQHVKGEPKGIGEGMWAAGVGLIEETPFVGQMLRVDKLFESAGQRDAYLGELLRSTLEPQLLIKAAQLTDTRFGEPVARKPKTIMEHVKMGIPGLRGDVPEKTTK